jgi:hypothetical protein
LGGGCAHDEVCRRQPLQAEVVGCADVKHPREQLEAAVVFQGHGGGVAMGEVGAGGPPPCNTWSGWG